MIRQVRVEKDGRYRLRKHPGFDPVDRLALYDGLIINSFDAQKDLFQTLGFHHVELPFVVESRAVLYQLGRDAFV